MKTLKIVKKTTVQSSDPETPIKVYDFTVKDDHHYVLSNGVLSHNSYVPMKDMGGGGGLKFAASTIIYLSKKKLKDDDGVIGSLITCKTYKSRFTKENQQVEVLLDFNTGLDRYYGLTDLAIESGVFKKVSTKVQLPDGSTEFESRIAKNPAKYFTPEIMRALEDAVQKKFKYCKGEKPSTSEEESNNDE